MPCSRFGNNSFVKIDQFLCSFFFFHFFPAKKFQRTSGCCEYKLLWKKPSICNLFLLCCHDPRYPSCSKEHAPCYPGCWAWRTLQTPKFFPLSSHYSLSGIRDAPGKRAPASSYKVASWGQEEEHPDPACLGKHLTAGEKNGCHAPCSLSGYCA